MLFAVVAAICLCVPVYGLNDAEPKTNEFLFLLDKIGQLEKQVMDMEHKLQKDVNVHLDLSESKTSTCHAGTMHFSGDFAPQKVEFQTAFNRPPVISHGITFFDTEHTHNARASCEIADISLTGFTMNCHTWADTVLHGLGVSWIAC